MLQGQIFIDMDELKDNIPLHDYVMKFLAEHGISGATSFRGHTGFGRDHQIKRPNELFSFDEPPMLITFIDEEIKVRQTIALLRKELSGTLIAVHKVERL